MVVGKIVSRVAFSMAMTVTARSEPVKPGHWVNLLRHTSLRAGRQPSTYTHVRLGLPARSRLVWLATCPSASAQTAPLPTWTRPCGARHGSTTIADRRCHETIRRASRRRHARCPAAASRVDGACDVRPRGDDDLGSARHPG